MQLGQKSQSALKIYRALKYSQILQNKIKPTELLKKSPQTQINM